jgi:alanine-synthesizing transaminase
VSGKIKSIKPADRTEAITYAVRDIILVAKEAAAAGKEMLYLNIGDPNQYDFQTPPHMIEAVYRAMRENQNGYAPSDGIRPALDAIEREAERKGIRHIQDIFITTGASEAIDLAMTALVDEGENVLIPYPTYPLYTAIISKLRAEPNPYYLDEAKNWQPDIEDIRSKIDEKTRAIVLINPNNPTGSLYSEEILRQLVDLALAHNIVLFCDEIYDKLLFDGKKHVSIASLSEEAPVLTFNGLSKSYLVPGFRIGWGIASGPAKAMKAYIEAIQKLYRARLCANHPQQYAILPALEGPQDHLKEVEAKLTRRRDITVERLNAIDGISCVKPDGAFYAFPSLDIEGEDEPFVADLIRETGVVVVHGSGFGQKPGTRHFRVVFLPPEDVLEKAYAQIEAFMAKRR